jgi:AbiV family abortive infection protein
MSNQSERSDTYYLDGYAIAIASSKSLFKIAAKSAEENEYGIACSLNILSAEEAIKAVFLFNKHYDKNAFGDDYKKMFKRHDTKHEHLSYFTEAIKTSVDETREAYEYAKGMTTIVEKLPDFPKQAVKSQLSTLYEIMKCIEGLKADEAMVNATIKWLESANEEKNNGLYTDELKDGYSWHNPRAFEKSKYEQERTYVECIIGNVEGMEMAYRITLPQNQHCD